MLSTQARDTFWRSLQALTVTRIVIALVLLLYLAFDVQGGGARALPGYAHTCFVDPVHLDRQGAAALSSDVADAIQSSLASKDAGDRWVRLPTYREPSVEVSLEDVEQSKALSKVDESTLRR